MKRRDALKLSATVAATSLVGIKGKAFSQEQKTTTPDKKLKILIAGAHPDDPECGCGGTALNYVNEGHEVVILYLTKGERGIKGKTYDEAAAIRTEEANKACEILGARPIYAGQINGRTVVTDEWYSTIQNIIEKENPDIVFTHWPIDSHSDHGACSLLIYQAWLRLKRKFSLYYFEVLAGIQTQTFSPTHYVEITSVIETKHKACFAHKSQKIEEGYPDSHAKMEIFRGMESRCKYAEAFIHHNQSPKGWLPPMMSQII